MKLRSIGLLYFVLSICIQHVYGQNLVINEFMADNGSSIQDEDGDYSDWIELYNTTNETINLLGYSLSDNEMELSKWKFPELNIQAHSFLIIFASSKNRFNTNELHTNFKISSEGEVLFLCNALGDLLDQTEAVVLVENETFGRFPDGFGSFMKLNASSLGSTNHSTNQLLFSHEGGFYKNPFYLKVNSLLGDTIYYTLDGSLPTEQSGILSDSLWIDFKYNSENILSDIPTTPNQSLISYKAWEAPDNNVDKGTILRCASFKNKVLSSEIYTQTLFVDTNIFEKYKLPIISLVTDAENLFSHDSGIYVPGIFYDEDNPEWTGNYFRHGADWERPVHIEFYEKNGDLAFAQNAGIRIHGGKTRQACQKTLRLYARQSYKEKYFNYKLFPQKDFSKYKRFLLRSSMGAWGGQTLLTDPLAHEISKDLNFETQDFKPVVVYINGEYWGIHTLRDRIDDEYLAYTADVNQDSVDLISGNYNIVNAGTNHHYVNLLEFISQNDLSFEANYNYVETQMDIDNYVDYQIAELFFQNVDWPTNNFKLWRPQSLDGKWRWIFYDLDAGFLNSDFNMFNFSTDTVSYVVDNYMNTSIYLFINLLKNPSFRYRFVTRYAEILNHDFEINTMINKLEAVKELYKNEIPHHISRWNYPDSYERWESDVDEGLLSFLKGRPCVVEEHIIDFFDLDDFAFYCDIDKEDKVKFIIAPNPSDGRFFILHESPKIKEVSVRVINSTGKLLYFEPNLELNAFRKKYIDLSSYSNNTYFVHIYNNEFTDWHKVVIIK